MEKLVEFLTTKIGYTLIVVLGFIVPGVVFIYAWDRNLFLRVDVIKLIMLSFGISFSFYLSSVLLCIIIHFLCNIITKKKEEYNDIVMFLGVPAGYNAVLVIILAALKMLYMDATMNDVIEFYGVPYIVMVFGGAFVIKIKELIQWIKKKIKI